jgi:hypothetical protein
MNERIEELLVEATDGACYDDNQVHALYGADIEKFAELIVKACLHNMENCDGDLDFAIWKTKKDFGVEE